MSCVRGGRVKYVDNVRIILSKLKTELKEPKIADRLRALKNLAQKTDERLRALSNFAQKFNVEKNSLLSVFCSLAIFNTVFCRPFLARSSFARHQTGKRVHATIST